MIYWILFVNIFSSVVLASSGEHHEDGVPRVVFYQAINVFIIFGSIVYFGRTKIVAFFNSRKNQFLQAQEKAQLSLRKAELEYTEVKSSLDKLKLTRAESISKAKTDANDMRTQMIQEAHSLVTKIKAEAQVTAKLELERAKSQLKEQIIKEAFELSKRDLSSKATFDDQRKLQEDFISKVQVVQ